MDQQAASARIAEIGIIPALRVSSAADALFAAETLCRGGIPIVEIPMTVPGAFAVLAELTSKYPDMLVGAGTVLDDETARRCLDSGAQFLTSTGFDLGVVELAVKQGVTILPGALTPTEVMAAWKAGADLVKVFPCAQMGGETYIRALREAFPNIPLIASGGVKQSTAAQFIHAGAVAIGVGKELLPHDAVEHRKADWILELVHRFLSIVRNARNHTGEHKASVVTFR